MESGENPAQKIRLLLQSYLQELTGLDRSEAERKADEMALGIGNILEEGIASSLDPSQVANELQGIQSPPPEPKPFPPPKEPPQWGPQWRD